VFLEHSEFALYRLQEEFAAAFPEVETLPLIGDVKDVRRIDQVLAQTRPKIVFHAAAYKHVPLMETQNAWQAIVNNVYGTYVLAKSCGRNHVQRFVMVSSDKAVNPVNVMGGSKRLAEMVCQAMQACSSTAMLIVRFGNVLGSAGSVVPKFEEQISRGGPLTVTHPEVTRYFMSIPEAAQLVLQAAAMGQPGQIYVLEMGEQVRIADLARNLIRLSGLTEDQIQIEFTGLRPGEKLYEETIDAEEPLVPTPHPKLHVAQACRVDESFLADIVSIVEAGPSLSDAQSRDLLMRWVPGYRPAVLQTTALPEEVPATSPPMIAVRTPLPAS
jgi:FlaA1/EpsC-like NDP-sugar epimerase